MVGEDSLKGSTLNLRASPRNVTEIRPEPRSDGRSSQEEPRCFLGGENYFICSVSLSCYIRFAFYLPSLIKIIRPKIPSFAEKVSNIICVTRFIGRCYYDNRRKSRCFYAGKAFGVYRLPTKE